MTTSPFTRLDTRRAARAADADADAGELARSRWANRAKPPGSLGRLEDLGVRLAAITGAAVPAVPSSPAVLVFAGDHGVVADGASAWPSEVTGLMVSTMVAGQAAINAFAETVGASVTLVDVGVAADLSDLESIVHAKVRPGTASFARGPAMTVAEAEAAIGVGVDTTLAAIDAGADLVVGGDMGIGNTTPSTALIAHFAGGDPGVLVGPGAGLTPDRMDAKHDLVAGAVRRVADTTDPVAVLAEIGGLEIAALAGCYLAATAAGVPAIVDGVIAAAGACVAEAIEPGTADRLIAGHCSTEPASRVALAHLGLVPLLDLDLRLGEGTGACLAVPLVQAAARALRDMAELPV